MIPNGMLASEKCESGAMDSHELVEADILNVVIYKLYKSWYDFADGVLPSVHFQSDSQTMGGLDS